MSPSIQENGKIDVVLFDFGGVIAEEGWKQGLKVIARANGLDDARFLQEAIDTIYATGHLLGKAPASLFWSALREKTGIKESDAFLANEILSRFHIRDWMIELAKELKAQKITVGILSDQTDMLDKLNQRYDFFRWFDHVFNSYHLGKGKRDSSLFDDVARILVFNTTTGNGGRLKPFFQDQAATTLMIRSTKVCSNWEVPYEETDFANSASCPNTRFTILGNFPLRKQGNFSFYN